MTVATKTDAPPPALAYSTDNCQVARAMAVLGESSTLLVLREVFNGVRRFDDMQRHSGVNRQVLSTRLATLVDQGVLRRVPYQPEGSRVRHEYRPTQKGLDLYPVLTALAEWGAHYLADPEGPAVEMTHRDCGARVRPVLTCDDGHEVHDHRDVIPRPGSGAKPFAQPA